MKQRPLVKKMTGYGFEMNIFFIFFPAGFGYGDLIQPGLLQLQPLLEDEFMELEPIPGKQYNY